MNDEAEWGSAHSNLFCIWRFNTIPLCSPTEALHRKGHEQNPSTALSAWAFPPAAVTADTQGKSGWIINTPRSWRRGNMTWRAERGMKRRWKESGDVKRQRTSSGYCFMMAFGDKSADCTQETDFLHLYPPLSISEFLLRKTYHHPIIFLQLALPLLPFGLSLIRVCRSSHARDTQDLTRLFPHKALLCLFAVLMHL